MKSPSWDLAGYGIADYNVKRVTFSLGARYDYIRVPFQNQLESDDNTTNTFHHFSPRGGISFDVGGGASVYGSVGGSFRAPAIVELACADPTASCPLPFALGDDPPLKPVRATTYEVGGKLLRGNVLFNASVYRTDVRDEIFFIESPGSLVSGYFTNLDKTRREGVELSVMSTLLEQPALVVRELRVHARDIREQRARSSARARMTTSKTVRCSVRTRSRPAIGCRSCRRIR